MAVIPIRYLPDPVLRQKAKKVPTIDKSIHKLIEDMIESMYAANGVGLAAPQIGVSKRLFIVDTATGRPRMLLGGMRVRIPSWSPQLGAEVTGTPAGGTR